jgi:DNA-binding YbaB/EbfC family protein
LTIADLTPKSDQVRDQENNMLKGLGGLGDMAGMMKKAQKMQTDMAELQEKLSEMTVMGESGAGLVKATATAKGQLIGLDIDPSIFHPDEKEVVEDLILAAVKDAQAKASQRAEAEMQKLTEGLGLPADFKLPF